MNVYISSSGKVFHQSPMCSTIGTSGPLGLEEVEEGTTALVWHRRLLHRCRRCWPGETGTSAISLREAASRLGISHGQAKRQARAGNFPGAFKLDGGSWWRVSVVALEKFLEAPQEVSP